MNPTPYAAFPLDIAKAHNSLDQDNHPQSTPSHSQLNGKQQVLGSSIGPLLTAEVDNARVKSYKRSQVLVRIDKISPEAAPFPPSMVSSTSTPGSG